MIVMSTLYTSLAFAVPALAGEARVDAVPGLVGGKGLPDPDLKAKSPKTNVKAFPKLTDEQLAAKVAQERKEIEAATPATDGSADVVSTETLPDGRVRVDFYSPAAGVTPDELAASLRKEGKKNVEVTWHDSKAQTESDVSALGAGDCAYGQARSVTCPVSYWTNLGRGNPVVVFSDWSGAAWPTDSAVYKWDTVPNIDSWYTYGQWCDPYGNVHCVNVDSGNYGAVGWQGHTARYYYPWSPSSGPLAGAAVQLNEYYPITGTSRNHIVTHELGHALGLGHNLWSGDVMYPIANAREDIGGENSMLLRSIYSIYR